MKFTREQHEILRRHAAGMSADKISRFTGFGRDVIKQTVDTFGAAYMESTQPRRPYVYGERAGKRRERRLVHLTRVAELYRQFEQAGSANPSRDTAERLGAKDTTVRTWVSRARDEGILGPRTEHRPRVVSWETDAWQACRVCRVEWPCQAALLDANGGAE